MMTEQRLRWVRTWPDDPKAIDDGCVRQADLLDPLDNARVMKREGNAPDRLWWWTASRFARNADGLIRSQTACGYAATKDEAQAAAEVSYFSAAR